MPRLNISPLWEKPRRAMPPAGIFRNSQPATIAMVSRIEQSGTTLITGASSGIGLALAHEFARHGHSLVLTAHNPLRLDEVRLELDRLYSARALTVAADLRDPEGVLKIQQALEAQDLYVDNLVNNAGLGFKGKFWELPAEDAISVARVNNEAVLRLTHLLLPGMVRRGHGRVLNVVSVAAFEPGPLMAVYHASKAFLLSFSEALADELAGSGVTVTALCPGATNTDFFPKAGMTNTRLYRRARLAAPRSVAKLGYNACLRGERLVVDGASNKALVFARRVMTLDAQAAMNRRSYEDADPNDHEQHSRQFTGPVR